MTLAPRFLVRLWARWCVSRFVRHLKSLGRGGAVQQAAFTRLMAQFAATEFGRTHKLTATTSYATFRENVPPGTYADLAPLLGRMVAGEPGVLTPGRCQLFVETAGTTGDRPKLLPVPEPMLAHFRQGLREALFLYAATAGHPGVFLGRHLHATTGSTALTEVGGTYRTGFDGIFTLTLSQWAEANLHSPPATIAELPEGAEKTWATVAHMMPLNVTLIGGTPAAVGTLALATRQAASTPTEQLPHLQALWPNLECFAFWGAPLGLYADALRAALGPTVRFHEIYAAAEGIIAAQDYGSPPALRLLTDTGLFFEFLPAREFNEETLAKDGSLCLPLEKVQSGVEYVLLVTTPAGLCRHVPGDIVRFVSVDPPRLVFVGRTGQQLNLSGEHVTESELAATLLAVCARNDWQAVNFHVAPYRHRVAAGQIICCHEWWLELRPRTVRTPTANVLGPELDAELAHFSRDYAARRADRSLAAPSVRLVIPGVFDQWAQERHKSTSASASKMPRCRSDRVIADQLAALTRFYQNHDLPSAE